MFDRNCSGRRCLSRMSQCSDQAEIDNRDDEDLVFAKVGTAKLSYHEDQTRGDDVPVAAASEHGILCLRDDEGIRGIRSMLAHVKEILQKLHRRSVYAHTTVRHEPSDIFNVSESHACASLILGAGLLVVKMHDLVQGLQARTDTV